MNHRADTWITGKRLALPSAGSLSGILPWSDVHEHENTCLQSEDIASARAQLSLVPAFVYYSRCGNPPVRLDSLPIFILRLLHSVVRGLIDR